MDLAGRLLGQVLEVTVQTDRAAAVYSFTDSNVFNEAFFSKNMGEYDLSASRKSEAFRKPNLSPATFHELGNSVDLEHSDDDYDTTDDFLTLETHRSLNDGPFTGISLDVIDQIFGSEEKFG